LPEPAPDLFLERTVAHGQGLRVQQPRRRRFGIVRRDRVHVAQEPIAFDAAERIACAAGEHQPLAVDDDVPRVEVEWIETPGEHLAQPGGREPPREVGTFGPQ
jgi:hypothetical protein